MGKILSLSVVTIVLFVSFGTAHAALKMTSPAKVCALLSQDGLATGAWAEFDAGKFGCNSPYKDIGAGFPLPNNLAYYVDGGSNAVTQAKLVLNVNNMSQASSGLSALATASDTLSLELGGMKLSASIKSAIRSGKPTSATLGKMSVKVVRENWPTGKGYEMHVIFK